MPRILYLIIFAFALSGTASSQILLPEAVKKGKVKIDIKGKGGHSGDVIEMIITNISGMLIELLLEPGLRLDSKDSAVQDILVNRKEKFLLDAGKKKTITVSGMCCQAHNHSPGKESQFSIGKMADSLLIKIARFIDEKKYYSSSAAQSGVWVISDNNPVESIYDPSDSSATRQVTEFVCKLLNKPIPDYRILYAADTASAFSNKPTHIEGKITYYVPNNSVVTIAIYDKTGKVVKAFMKEQPVNPGEYNLGYEFNVSTLPHGKYYLRVRVDGALKKEVELEF